MAQNKVMKLWTAIVTAVLALCTALGLITTTASAAVPQTGTTRNCAAPTTTTAMSLPARPHDRALPPTMKQRIRAEAHGSSPSCRHRALLESAGTDSTVLEPSHSQAERPVAPLQR
ncbi:DUF6344 domain-containing protein [Streptomyces bottropensis]|uniref:Secreted protein n=2 Tax=Streptomyces bottropensis TaxID=42235 RepID=M3FI67_9ACTN|nr:DUF6344 domain-containing protein [Streptomyces bottropensis]EMF52630.1 hypothetical protein SBD_5706 [Streptomyces bottropensis ATCC 25435]MZD21721.1 hypothetical protein [Streptomyces sp. SID5476]